MTAADFRVTHAQTHRRTIDAMSLRRWDAPFEIVRPVPAASAHPALANAQSATEAGGRKDLAS